MTEAVISESRRLAGPGGVPAIPEPAAPAPLADGPQVVATWQELQGVWRIFAVSEWLLRDRGSFFDEIRTILQIRAQLHPI